MVYVPAGKFLMGEADEDESGNPIHTVVLDAFWLDRTEVTVAQFRTFFLATGYQTGADERGRSWVFTTHWAEVDGANWEHPIGPQSVADDTFPAVHVSWHDAVAYCRWAGGRLPTEAEWEYAARGPAGSVYPWGDEFDGARLNLCDRNCEAPWATPSVDDGYAFVAPVGSYPSGASWIGAFDLSGNVWEWVQDWYEVYPSVQQINPTGPRTGERRVLRGASWYDSEDGRRGSSADRNSDDPTITNVNNGFRCAVDR